MYPMTFDALPYDMLRRIAAYLERGDMSQLSRADMKRAVLSFCVWERTPVAKGGGLALAPPHVAGGPEEGEGRAASGHGEDCDTCLGAPIYRFLGPCGRPTGVEESRCSGSEAMDAKTVLASYPRSGNSLLRRLLEEVTGTITGSDTRPDRTLSRSLSVFGMQGEGVVDHRVRVVKTHYPERLGFRPFEGSKVILLVRNPFDAIDSYFNMALTNTHDQSLHDCVYDEFREFWDGLVRNEIKVWERFHVFWLSTGVPMHVVRYEDLLSRPEETLASIVAFVDDTSAAEVEEAYGDRIRRAPAAVNARRRPERTRDGAVAGVIGHPAPCKGAQTTSGAKPDRVVDGTPTTVANGSGGEVAADGEVIRRGGGSGPYLYQPRTSGRRVGGSLGKRFNEEQVAWFVRETGTLLRQLGYDPVSQGFPTLVSADLLELERLQSLYASTGGGGGGCESVQANSAKNESDKALPRGPRTANKKSAVVTVNDKAAAASAAVRGEGDAYGRAMTPFRRFHTKRDTKPLPLRGEDSKAEEWRQRRRGAKEAKSPNTDSSVSGGNHRSSSIGRQGS
eukprot:g5696.t1